MCRAPAASLFCFLTSGLMRPAAMPSVNHRLYPPTMSPKHTLPSLGLSSQVSCTSNSNNNQKVTQRVTALMAVETVTALMAVETFLLSCVQDPLGYVANGLFIALLRPSHPRNYCPSILLKRTGTSGNFFSLIRIVASWHLKPLLVDARTGEEE